MAKRKASNGLILRSGESERPDGRFRYRYVGPDGKSHDIYSWRLRPEDPVPEGRKPGKSLRELEGEISLSLAQSLKPWEGTTTLNVLVQEYLKSRSGNLSTSSQNAYEFAYHCHIEGSKIGGKKLTEITPFDVSKFYETLLNEKRLSVSTVGTVDTVLSPTFDLAVARRIIDRNPASGALAALKKKNKKAGRPKVRHALEQQQLDDVLEFIRNDDTYSVYHDIFYVLAWTGMRASELLGLTWFDVDFQRELLFVRRSFSYKKVAGKYTLMVKSPKSEAGVRSIPMLRDVKEILLRLKRECKVTVISPPKAEIPEVSLNDPSAFVFRNARGTPILYKSLDEKLLAIMKKYNSSVDEDHQITDLTCHVFRHTFCSWLCETYKGESTAGAIKAIQRIMGHASAQMTLDVYAELRSNAETETYDFLKQRAAR